MYKPTTYQTYNNVALITLAAPPVNALGHTLRSALLTDFQRAIDDDGVQAIVIISSGELFCGGADISEFDSGLALSEPALPELLSTLEESGKIIVAAINGAALGGGFELALACDYRIAIPQAKLSLPEVLLGILPGAGGTQRLPRLGNPQLALEMITSGRAKDAAALYDAGVIDRLHNHDGDFLNAALSYAEELIKDNAPLRSCNDIEVETTNLPNNYFADFRQSIARRSRGYYAPERCIQCVEFACELPLREGLAKEKALCLDCMNTPQARAQQHLFFAEREALKIPGLNPQTPERKINKVAVIGSGTMGGGIAMNFINAGIETVILDLNVDALERGLGIVRNNYEISAQKGRLNEVQVNERLALLSSTTDYTEIADVDLVIEAVFEDMEIKQKVFKTLDKVCKPGTILASNTSTLDLNLLAATTQRPQDVLGLHFFSPANVMRLVEIVRGTRTADDVLITGIKLAKTINKVPVVAGVAWGFIGNRMIEPYGREAARLVLEGADPGQIDRVLYDFGMAMGIFSTMDLAGIDIGYLARRGNKDSVYSRDPAYCAICDKLYDLGRYGQKSGHGFYIYEGREKKQDPEVMDLAAGLAANHGIKQRRISDQEILERTIFALINEGAQVLSEGISYRSGDIDTVYCNGYGFPVYRGGPMQYADEIGLETVLEAFNKYRIELGDYGECWFEPSPLLEKLVAEKKKFKDFIVTC